MTENTFSYCYNLEKIEVDPKNARFCSEDGVLFSKDKKELLTCPAGKTDKIYKVPDEVKKIWPNAFAFNKYISEVQLPDKLKYIGREAFLNSNLRRIYLPDSLEELNYHAFAGCHHLEQIRIPDIEIFCEILKDNLDLKQINVSKTFVKNHQEFVEKFKDKIKTSKTLEDLLDEGASFKEINRILKDENAER